MPYWIASTLAATPAFVWIFFGLGLPSSLTLLPRKDWHDTPLVLCVAFALGPGLLTAWMFLLVLLGFTLRFDVIFAGTVGLALLGTALAWRKRYSPVNRLNRKPLGFVEKLVITLIALALVIRWFGSAYWPFTAYDALWVFGYEGRLYTLLGTIPSHIAYYPQFLPLQYTFAQLAVGDIDDHAARAGLIFLHMGSILAAYVLGSRLLNRRAGIFAAALWALYPHVGEWSRFGDLEIPVTFLFTASAAFFLMAWVGQPPRRRYALIAGILFGIAMWTKPTAGALVWGVLLLLAIEFVRVQFDARVLWPRLEVALIMGLASAPLGIAWYARNVLLGHHAIDLPPAFWQTLAEQSGKEFGWPLLALLLLLGYLYLGRRAPYPDRLRGLVGLTLVLAGLVPSILSPHRITLVEWSALLAGAALLALTLWQYARAHVAGAGRNATARIGWALALALPYFITWFFSYSYHYRLSFAIVPLMVLPTAAILDRWIRPEAFATTQRKIMLALAVLSLSVTGILVPLYDVNAGWSWLASDVLPDDMARYRSGNAALIEVVEGLQVYLDTHDEPLVVAAPGIKRLPFFFPLEDIRVDETPTRLDDLRAVTYFVYGAPESIGAYEDVPPLENQVVAALARSDIVRRAWWMDDGIFRYEVYEMQLENQWVKRQIVARPREGEVVFGGFARFLGHDLGGDNFWPGRRVQMHLYWEVLSPPPDDLTFFVHVRDRTGRVIASWDGPVAPSEDGRYYYSTLLWEPKELITDARTLELPNGIPAGGPYRMMIGLYDPETGRRIPLTINGKPANSRSYRLDEKIWIVAEASE